VYNVRVYSDCECIRINLYCIEINLICNYHEPERLDQDLIAISFITQASDFHAEILYVYFSFDLCCVCVYMKLAIKFSVVFG
jgi:hypothetical protein